MNSELIEKTEKFGEEVIRFCRNVCQDNITQTLTIQLVKAATNIGATIVKTDGNLTQSNLINRLNVCREFCFETKHWIRMIAEADSDSREAGRELWKETQELVVIFTDLIVKFSKK